MNAICLQCPTQESAYDDHSMRLQIESEVRRAARIIAAHAKQVELQEAQAALVSCESYIKICCNLLNVIFHEHQSALQLAALVSGSINHKQ